MPTKFELLASAVVIGPDNKGIRVDEDGPGGDIFTAVLTEGTFYLTGTGGAEDLAKNVEDALIAGSPGGVVYTVDYTGLTAAGGETGQTEWNSTSPLALLWTDPLTTIDPAIFGFPEADTVDALSVTSPLSPSATWVPNQPVRIMDPAAAERTTFQHATPNNSRYTFVASDKWNFRTLGFENIAEDRTWEQYAPTDPARTFEAFWEIVGDGRPVGLYRTTEASQGVLLTLTVPDLVDVYKLTADALTAFDPIRGDDSIALFDWRLPLVEAV